MQQNHHNFIGYVAALLVSIIEYFCLIRCIKRVTKDYTFEQKGIITCMISVGDGVHYSIGDSAALQTTLMNSQQGFFVRTQWPTCAEYEAIKIRKKVKRYLKRRYIRDDK